ncbi:MULTISPECIES: helix-turn-helix domain-containing protein [Clostridium]|uniref:DNA binding domain, excisionase family n=2 Tax=Clostridium TaxID=1485 RepID=A0A381JBD8_9CLOT|nr:MULTISPECIES: helix-turn-helix domain-containing protein [Clostridium]MBB6630670.1 helix-turn-helix domain-containing protein [Clostridium algidicarnis]PPK44972.1 excisionase family DNA binding protein [Clostridium algidicarnis DSM 15099]SUY47707.1 DNA binding domain, excisionase family [Clostridium putrefaciens]
MKTYSVKQIADLLETNPETVRRWIRDGRLTAVQASRKDGNIVTDDELKRFLRATPKYLPKVTSSVATMSPTVGLATLAAGLVAGAVISYCDKKGETDVRVLPEDFEKHLKENIKTLNRTILQKKSLIVQTEKEIEGIQKQIEQYQHLLEHDEVIKDTIKKAIDADEIKED